MNPVFIDTSFLLALPFEKDALWSRARAWQRALPGPFLTTEFVLLEIGDALAKASMRKYAEKIIAFVREDQGIKILSADSLRLDNGYRLFLERPDQDWGLTDCVSFAVMTEMGLTDALTYDHHFEQAGFRALLRSDPPSN